jgi:hypothetical protein
MFSFLFKPKKECFICYTTGKTEQEEIFELFFNIEIMNYPLISMCDAYSCKCINYYAHNKCLLNVNKCPTCRKETKPKLYITTKYDFYLKYLLNYLKKDTSKIVILNWHMLYSLIFGLLLLGLGLCALYEKEKEIKMYKLLPTKSFINLCFSTIIVSLIFIPLYFFTNFDDYLKKYWLYNKNTKKYDVFNNEPCDEPYDNVVQLQTVILQQRSQIFRREILIAQQRERITQLSQQILQSGLN